jgi:uncharacterized Zn finger protein (UPF0148 family)
MANDHGIVPDCKNGCNAGAQFVPTPDMTHHGKMICPKCGAWLAWVRKPENEKRRRGLEAPRKKFQQAGVDYCQMCLRKRDELPLHVTLSVHHVIEVQDGGTDEPGNMWLVCSICHEMIHLMRRNGRQIPEHEKVAA